MGPWYYFNQTNQRFGPYDETALAEFARQGKITPNTVFVTEDGHRQRAADIPNLFSAPSNSFAMGTQPPPQSSLVCANCGGPLRMEQVVCLQCGAPVARRTCPDSTMGEERPQSKVPFVFMYLCSFIFAFPIVTLILWLVTRGQNPIADRHGKNIINTIISFMFIFFAWIGVVVFWFMSLVNRSGAKWEDVVETPDVWVKTVPPTELYLLGSCVAIFLLYVTFYPLLAGIMGACNAGKGKVKRLPFTISLFRIKDNNEDD